MGVVCREILVTKCLATYHLEPIKSGTSFWRADICLFSVIFFIEKLHNCEMSEYKIKIPLVCLQYFSMRLIAQLLCGQTNVIVRLILSKILNYPNFSWNLIFLCTGRCPGFHLTSGTVGYLEDGNNHYLCLPGLKTTATSWVLRYRGCESGQENPNLAMIWLIIVKRDESVIG